MVLKVSHRDDDNKIRDYICIDIEEIGLVTLYVLKDIQDWWEHQFKVMGKDWVSSDFVVFVEYMNSPDREMVFRLEPENVISREELTDEEMEKHNKELWQFYRNMDLEPEKMAWQGFDISNQISMLKEA